jgi:hypothetical protein
MQQEVLHMEAWELQALVLHMLQMQHTVQEVLVVDLELEEQLLATIPAA